MCSSNASSNVAKQLSSQQLANLASDTPYNPNILIGVQTAKFTIKNYHRRDYMKSIETIESFLLSFFAFLMSNSQFSS